MALEFSERVRRIPVYPAAGATRCPRTSRCWPPTSRPTRRCRRSSRRSRASLGALNRYPDPTNAELRAALSDRYGVPADADRDRQRLVRHPAGRRRGAARARRRARLRVAVVLASTRTWRPRRARRAIRVPLDARRRHDLDAMLARDHRRDAARDRLQPEQPDVDGAAGSTRSRLRRARSRATSRVILDEAYCEFNTLDDPDASHRPPAQSHPNLVLLRTFSKVYGLCGLRVGFALCGDGGLRHARSTRCASRSSATPPRRPRRSRRCATRTRSPSASSGRSSRASRSRRRCASLGISPPSRRRTSPGSTCRPDGEEPPRSRPRRARARRARRARARGQRAGPRGRAARDLRDAGAERALPARARRSALGREPLARQHGGVGPGAAGTSASAAADRRMLRR